MQGSLAQVLTELNVNGLPLRFGVNVIAVLLMTVGLYYRRYRRSDVLVVLISFNVGLFAVLTVITDQRVSAGVGFGLFAILSIIRLRSEPVSNVELSYFFMTLAIGLVNGFSRSETPVVIALNVAIVLTLWLVDLQLVHTAVRSRTVLLAQVETDVEAIRQKLQGEFGLQILSVSISDIDYVRETTRVVVRYIADPVKEPLVAQARGDDE